jgi:hypothetical protein
MLDINLTELQPYAFVLLGIILLLVAIFKKSGKANLKSSGLKTEGIIHGLGYSNAPNSDTTPNIKDKVTVRFTTNKKEWITVDIDQKFAVYFSNQYKEGQKVDVYYDPENPSDFFVDTKQSETIGRQLFAVVGLAFCVVGAFQLFLRK